MGEPKTVSVGYIALYLIVTFVYFLKEGISQTVSSLLDKIKNTYIFQTSIVIVSLNGSPKIIITIRKKPTNYVIRFLMSLKQIYCRRKNPTQFSVCRQTFLFKIRQTRDS